eukprot:3987833-Amphidinium_carterae.1
MRGEFEMPRSPSGGPSLPSPGPLGRITTSGSMASAADNMGAIDWLMGHENTEAHQYTSSKTMEPFERMEVPSPSGKRVSVFKTTSEHDVEEHN